MRILQVLPSIKSASGGPPRSTLANCRALHKVDPDVETVLLSTDEDLRSGWRKELGSRSPDRMTVKAFPGRGRHTARFSVSLLRWVYKNVNHFDLVVIRALLHPLSSAVARVSRTRNVPYLLVPHGTLSRYTFQHRHTIRKLLYYDLIEANTIENAAALRFTAKAELEEARRLQFDTPGVVIPHPFNPQFDYSPPPAARSQQLLFMARFDPKKGIPVLLDAVDLLRRDTSSVRLVLAGSGAETFEEKIRSRVRKLGLTDTVVLPGFVEGATKRRLLEKSSVFVLPSKQENFAVSVVEAMDAGLPVVVSKGVDIWPDIADHNAGVVLDNRTANSIARHAGMLLKDKRTCRNMGQNGRQLVKTAFNPTRVGRKVSALYRAAIKGSDQVSKLIS